MTLITQSILAEAVVALQRMGTQEQLRLGDEISARQPNLLGSVIVLRRMGASDAQIGIALHVLFVAWLAMKHSGQQWPVISEDVQDLCMQRLTARVRFSEGFCPELLRQAIQQHTDEHEEPHLLAFVLGHLREHTVLEVKSDAEKYVLLCALNIVECLAYSAPLTARKSV